MIYLKAKLEVKPLPAGDERPSLADVEIPFLPDVPVMAAIMEHDAVERVRRLKPLSLLPLVALIFYDVSGGPFGIEVRALHCTIIDVTAHEGRAHVLFSRCCVLRRIRTRMHCVHILGACAL